MHAQGFHDETPLEGCPECYPDTSGSDSAISSRALSEVAADASEVREASASRTAPAPETVAYIAVRRAGYDLPRGDGDGTIPAGQEYFDFASMSATEGWARDMALAHGRLVSGAGFDANAVHPVVRVARVRVIESAGERGFRVRAAGGPSPLTFTLVIDRPGEEVPDHDGRGLRQEEAVAVAQLWNG